MQGPEVKIQVLRSLEVIFCDIGRNRNNTFIEKRKANGTMFESNFILIFTSSRPFVRIGTRVKGFG